MELFINERVCRTHRGEKLLWLMHLGQDVALQTCQPRLHPSWGCIRGAMLPASPQQKACSIQAFRGDSPERHALGNNFSPQNTEDTFARDAFKTHISAQEYNCALKFILV